MENDDNLSLASDASATYNQVKDLLHGVIRDNRANQYDVTFLKKKPAQNSVQAKAPVRAFNSPSPNKRLVASKLQTVPTNGSPARPNDFDRLLAAQALAQDHELSLKKQANEYQNQMHQLQTEKEA